MSGLVTADKHITSPTASLYGQSPIDSPSFFGPIFTPGVGGMLDNEVTSKPFRVISKVPGSQSRLKSQPVYQVSSPRLFVGNFATNAARNRPNVQSRRHLHERPSSGLPCRPQPCENTRMSPRLFHAIYSTTVSTSNPAHRRPLCFRQYSDMLRRTAFSDMSPHPSRGYFHVDFVVAFVFALVNLARRPNAILSIPSQL